MDNAFVCVAATDILQRNKAGGWHPNNQKGRRKSDGLKGLSGE
jgi:hypothetical protein